METKTEMEDVAGKRLVDMVRHYVNMADRMANIIGKTFANSEDVQLVVREVKKSGVNLIDSVSGYTKAVEDMLNSLNKVLGVTK